MRLELTIEEAGGLLYLADRGFGGLDPGALTDFFGGREGLADLTGAGAIMAMSLYQDDGYTVRLVVGGDLSAQEQDDWTSRARAVLEISSGRLIVSGVCDEDLGSYLDDFTVVTESGQSCDLGAFVDLPNGRYQATVTGYAPADLAGGWMRIEDPDLFRQAGMGAVDGPKESVLEYFRRTRPGQDPRPWHVDGWEDASFVSFVVHLEPLGDAPGLGPAAFEPDGCVEWEFRKPDVCPMGLEPEGY